MSLDEINDILSGFCDEGNVEPIDEDGCHPMDWAEITGLADELGEEIYPEPTAMIDENGFVWFVS
jgi:hypothetical protein